jgi:hypothetical protein
LWASAHFIASEVIVDINKATAGYLKLRTIIAEKEKAHKAEIAELKEKQTKIQNWLQAKFEEIGFDNVKTDHGTAFKATKDSIRVSNKAEFMQFIVDQVKESGVDGLYLMSVTANKTATKEYMEDHEDMLPPGVKYDSWTEIQVRSK